MGYTTSGKQMKPKNYGLEKVWNLKVNLCGNSALQSRIAQGYLDRARSSFGSLSNH